MAKHSGQMNISSNFGKIFCLIAGMVHSAALQNGRCPALLVGSAALFLAGLFIWIRGEHAQRRRASSNAQIDRGFSLPNTHAPEPLTSYLDAIGFPWRLSRGDLQHQFGIRPHPAYQWDVVEVPSLLPFVKGLLWPLSYNVKAAHPDLPVVEFSGHSYYCGSARKNLRLTVKELRPIFGEGTPDGMGHRWDLGAASVQLIVWGNSSDGGQQSNPAHDREPRLKTACHITVNVGYRPLVSAADQIRLENFVPIAPIVQTGIPLMPAWFRPAPENILEFIRIPGQEELRIRGWIGHSADRAALIFFNDELVIIPMHSVLEYVVERIRPAKGPGGSWLSVKCKCDYDEKQTKSVPVCNAYRADDLDELATMLSIATVKPHVQGDYTYDC